MAMMAAHIQNTSSSCIPRLQIIRASLNIPNSIRRKYVSFPNLSSTLVEELKSGNTNMSIIEKQFSTSIDQDNSLALEKMYAILESVLDRVEMHNNIGEQRDRWNTLFLTSINTITLTATTLLSIASNSTSSSSSSSCLNLSSTLLFLAATGMLTVVNKIQPSQLVEEQRNAARLFKQLQYRIQTIIKMGNPTSRDVMESMEKVLALDKAYPLPLLGSMLDKFPSTVEPAVWWPTRSNNNISKKKDIWNGWNGKLEEEMRRIVEVIKKKDKSEYLRLGEKALKLNKMLALTGPLLTGLAAVGSAYASSSTSSSSSSSWGGMVGMVAGVLASVANTVEHGGQVGMVFEMYRNNAGFFKLMEETIESNLSEREVEKRENGELFEMKMALQLGRSLSELRELGSSTSLREDEFASKLF